MKNCTRVIVWLLLVLPTVAHATTWYVRADGGARWSSNRASNGLSAQCNGKADASYASAFSAAGSPSAIPSGGLPCAFNDLRFMWDDQATYNTLASVMAGGDTLIIGDPTNAYQAGENAWRVGYDRNASNGSPITNGYPVWCWGVGYCYMAPFPAGTASNPTHIWGRNAGNCHVGNGPDKSKLTRIAGGENTGADFTADGANLDIQCLELLPEHSTMAGRGAVCGGGSYGSFTSPNGALPPPYCNSHPEYDASSQGLTLTNTSNVVLTDSWIHNHSDSGIKGPFANLTLERVIIESNNSAGINTDNGCDNAATEPSTTSCMSNVMPKGASFSMDNTLITGSGCLHTVPYTGETGWLECSDQSHGGYGDGIGTAACLQAYADGSCHYGQHPNVSITHSILRYNVQDGEDFGHVDGDDGQTLNFVFTNSLSYGNGGGQIKFGWGYDQLTIINNVLLANCARLAYPFQGQSTSFFNPMAASGQDLGLCRSGDFFSFNVNNNTVANIDHNTFVGYPPTFFDYKCVTIEATGGTGSSPQPNCDNTVVNLRNNIVLAYANYDFLQAVAYGGNSGPAPYCGASCNNSTGNGNDGGLIGTWNSSNNIYYGLRSCPANAQRPSTKNGTSVNEQCIDPLLVNEPLAGVTGNSRVGDPVDAMFDNYNFALASNSPAKGGGITVSGESTDYVGASYASTPAIGGLEYGSNAIAPVITSATGLNVTYGTKGVQTIAFNGTTLEDIGQYGNDQFHIWHMITEDLNGNVSAGWGETATAEAWNASTNTETYTFPWGTLAVQFAVSGNTLNMTVTVSDTAGSGVVFDGAEIYPFALHFASDPFGGYSQWKPSFYGPSISIGDFGSGVVGSAITSPAIPSYGGWKQVAGQNSESGAAYSPIMATTLPDGAANWPAVSMHLTPGNTATYTASVRFANEGSSPNVSDVLANYATTYPATLKWPNHNPIGTVYVASSTSGGSNGSDNNASVAAGCGATSANPRNYKDAGGSITCGASKVNSTAYQDQILADARGVVTNSQAFNAQGNIVWDLEGEEFSQPTTYVCSPDQIAFLSPEMEQTITTTTAANSAYVGMKLDDAFFAIQRSAGLAVGVCLRPNQFILESSSATDPNNPNVTLAAGSAVQVFPTSTTQAIQWLEKKIAYANQRWGATLFYTDSMVDTNGMPLSPDVLKQVNADYPNVLVMPEAQNGGSYATASTTTTATIGVPLRYYAYSAPFDSFIFHTDIGTPVVLPGASLYTAYPNAFSTILINDANATAITNFTPQLTAAVSKGDILMGHADYDDEPNNADIKNINTAGGYKSTTPLQAIVNLIVHVTKVLGCGKGCHF